MQIQLLDLFPNQPTLENFIALGNEHIIHVLAHPSNYQFIHLCGVQYTGKTHLLKAWTHTYMPNDAIYMDQTCNFNQDISQYKYIAIDNIHLLDNQQQDAIFNLFNTIKLNNLNKYLLTSSNINLEQVPQLRRDVTTRLLSGINLTLKALNDEELINAMNLWTNNQGIHLGILEQNYLINHHPRNIGMLIQTISKLSQDSSASKRPITIPFIKEVLDISNK